MYTILSVMRGDKKQKHQYKKAIKIMERQGSRHPHYIEGAVLLAKGESLVFLDQLKNANRELGPDEVHQLCKIALIIKEPKILEPLVQLHKMLPKNHDTRVELYNSLVNLYGQKSDIDALEVLWSSLKKQIKITDRHYYKHVFQRCRHFFRCNNRRTPDDLFFVLKDLGDF